MKDFVAQIPLKHFEQAFFPRLSLKIKIEDLEATLEKVVKLKEYEHGIILY